LTTAELEQGIVELAQQEQPERDRALPYIEEMLSQLEQGSVRAAFPGARGWEVCGWIKQGILLAFRVGSNRESVAGSDFHFRDRDTLPTWNPNTTTRTVRIVPGGSTVRRGAYVGDGVVIMPPAYINVGAYVGSGSMIDSHALVGSCAQVGASVHLSAAAQIGGVLEPIGAMPVILEEGVFVGGGCGIYEGTRVAAGAVLAPGVVLNRGVPVIDLVRQSIHRASPGQPLVIPERAVVVPGTRPATGEFARRHQVQLQAPVIVKYRDASTNAALALEEALR